MPRELTGVVLAGGLSSRLGHDKVLLRLHGGQNLDLLAHGVALLERVCAKVLVVGRERPGYACFPDKVPGCGPVGGIATALEVSNGPCLVLSCDLPFMESAVLEKLVRARDARPPDTLSTAYRQKDTGHIEALVAVYEPGCLPYFQESVRQRLLKISLIVPREQQHFLDYSIEEALPFFNINYPADLEVARRMLHE